MAAGGGGARRGAAEQYTALLLGLAVLAWIVADGERRRWLCGRFVWLGALVAALCTAPVLAWNATHGWASLLKQGGRVEAFRPVRAAQFLGELLAGQVGLATPLVWALCAAGLVTAVRRWRDPGWGLLSCAGGLPALVFAEHALGDRVQANWVAVVYPACAIAAAGLAGRWRRLTIPAVALGAAMTALVWLQGVASPLHLARRYDPTLMRLAAGRRLAADVSARAHAEGLAFIADDGYGDAAMLARLVPDDLAVLGPRRAGVFSRCRKLGLWSREGPGCWCAARGGAVRQMARPGHRWSRRARSSAAGTAWWPRRTGCIVWSARRARAWRW